MISRALTPRLHTAVPQKTKVALQNVTLTGVGRYQDVTDGTGVKADTYTQYFTATNTYEHIHSENENAVTVTESGSSVASAKTPTEHTAHLTDTKVLNPKVYQGKPHCIVPHPDIFFRERCCGSV